MQQMLASVEIKITNYNGQQVIEEYYDFEVPVEEMKVGFPIKVD